VNEQTRITLTELRQAVEALQPDVSATAPEHMIGAVYGQRLCRDRVLGIIDEMMGRN